jgi:hypothetical protein
MLLPDPPAYYPVRLHVSRQRAGISASACDRAPPGTIGTVRYIGGVGDICADLHAARLEVTPNARHSASWWNAHRGGGS